MRQPEFDTVYERHAVEYDQWFDRHPNLFNAELLALRQSIPPHKTGVEIGVGTGRFALHLNIKYGVEPAKAMADIARKRGITVYEGVAEKLPIGDSTFDFVLMVTVDCFLNDIKTAFLEAYRILKAEGVLIIGVIDRNSELGKKYEQEKSSNMFYEDARFHSTEDIAKELSGAGFGSFQYWQTLIDIDEHKTELPQAGFGKGSFVVIKAFKTS